MVLDRENKIAYACLSPRTDKDVLDVFFVNRAVIRLFALMHRMKTGKAIYHTNVLMCVGSKFVVICLDSVPNPHERVVVSESLTSAQRRNY